MAERIVTTTNIKLLLASECEEYYRALGIQGEEGIAQKLLTRFHH